MTLKIGSWSPKFNQVSYIIDQIWSESNNWLTRQGADKHVWAKWIFGQAHQILITCFPYRNNVSMWVWSEFTRMSADNKLCKRRSDRICTKTIWAISWENLFMTNANNKGADQPTHPRSLIITFVFRCLDSIIPLVSISEFQACGWASRFESYLVANPKDRFSCDEAHMSLFPSIWGGLQKMQIEWQTL